MSYPVVKKRHIKRLSINYGIEKAEKIGFTDNINHDGLFIRTGVTVKPGGIIVMEINHPGGLISMTGEVRWAKQVPKNYLHKLRGGMGIRIISFTAGEDLYFAMCNELMDQRGS